MLPRISGLPFYDFNGLSAWGPSQDLIVKIPPTAATSRLLRIKSLLLYQD